MNDCEGVIRAAPCHHCYVCGGEGVLLYESLTDRVFGVDGRWNLRKCNNADCGTTWMDPMPLESEIFKAYQTYYTHGKQDHRAHRRNRSGVALSIVRGMQQAWWAAMFLRQERTKLEQMYLDDLAPGRLLEVGCGDGKRLALMRNLDWDVEGQDVDRKAAENAQQTHDVNVYVGELVQLSLPAKSYDAIIMNHVIEHVYDPIALLNECHRLLKQKGVLVATTPNPNSLGHAVFKSAWRGLEVPRHLHLFPPAALERIASAAGFSKHRAWTTPARAGGIGAASWDIKRTGTHTMGGQLRGQQIISTALYQFVARIAYVWEKGSGEESVLRAEKC
jgi:2-polyprenyl-3-methyl-5-hydroxy-6-metoxy-1,4-benzoquinol methylase